MINSLSYECVYECIRYYSTVQINMNENEKREGAYSNSWKLLLMNDHSLVEV